MNSEQKPLTESPLPPDPVRDRRPEVVSGIGLVADSWVPHSLLVPSDSPALPRLSPSVIPSLEL